MSNFIKQHIANLKKDRETVMKEISDAHKKIADDTLLLDDINRVIDRLADMVEPS